VTTSNTAPSISRRTALAGLGAGALGLALATHRRDAFAQDATPAATAYPMAGHPVIGVWQVTLEAGIPGSSLAVFVFAADGGFVAAHEEDSSTTGAWRATGERTADVIQHQQNIASPDFFAPDYAGAGPDPDPVVWLWRLEATIDATGNVMDVTGKVDIYRDGTLADGFDGVHSAGVRMDPVVVSGTPTS
jgi:hypothetical protein